MRRRTRALDAIQRAGFERTVSSSESQLGPKLPQRVSEIVASYESDDRTHYLDGRALPSGAAIQSVCDLLCEISFPGYVGRRDLTRHNVAYHVGELLPRLWQLLQQEIEQALCHEAERSERSPCRDECRRRASEITDEFVRRIPEIRALLADDVQAHYDGDPAATCTSEIILAYPGMLAITLHRYAHLLYLAGVPLVPRMMNEIAHRRTGIDIHPGARIGRRFCIDHGTGVVIGETTEIGDNCKIYQGVTLGALSFPRDERGRLLRGFKRHPTVKDNVTIYANAIILGGDTVIHDGAVIGGSVFLTSSVAAGHQVSLAPPELKVRPSRRTSIDGEPQPDYCI
ncbi:MAG: serine acetyltransferase [Planctomycetota bacterium]|nr:MAG: serine acetyltransferase [Planctomycetota bacterium]